MEVTQVPETVTPDVCKLHREVIDQKIESLKQKDDALDSRMKGIETKIAEVFQLQKVLLYVVIFIAFGVICTLLGVLFGRGIDLGWIIP